MLHITVIANEKKKKNTGWGGVKKCRKKRGLWGLAEERKKKERKWGRCERMDGAVERGKVESGIDRGKEWEEYVFDTPAPWGFSLSLQFCWVFLCVCDTESRGKWPKTVDEKGNPIKLRLHVLSVHLTSSVIFQFKPPGPDRSGPTHVNTNLWKTLGSVAARKKPTNCPVFSRLNTVSCVRFLYDVPHMYESEMRAEADKAVNIRITVHDATRRLKM